MTSVFDERLLGSEVEAVEMSRSALDWKRHRREQRMTLREFPGSIRKEIAPVRRDDTVASLVELVTERVTEIATERGWATTIIGDLGTPTRVIVQASYRRRILNDLARNQSFLGLLRKTRRSMLRLDHKIAYVEFADGEEEYPSEVPEILGPPRTGPWRVPSCMGLGTAQFLDAGPEGWFVWVAQAVAGEVVDAEGDVDVNHDLVSVLALQVGPSVLPRAITFKDAARRLVEITPVDLDSIDLSRRRAQRHFDYIVVSFPAPACGGAANHPRIHEGRGSSTGPKKWKRKLEEVFRFVEPQIKNGATGYLLVPTGIREGESFVDAPELLDALTEHLQTARVIETVEVDPVPQPFVGKNRPTYRTVILGGRP
jgi:hypothetical protein